MFRKGILFLSALPYAAFLLWPAIYFYYSIYLYQPYELFLIRLPIYALINLFVYGVALCLTGSKEKAVLGTLAFFSINLLLIKIQTSLPIIKDIHIFWNVCPEALLIPFLIMPLLRLIKVGQRVARFIHVSVLVWIALLHFRLGARWIRNRYYLQVPPAQTCPALGIQDTLHTYPDIYCLVLDAFGHPDTLRHYIALHLSIADSLSAKGFIFSSLSLPYRATLPAIYYFLSPSSSFVSFSDLEAHIRQKNHYNILDQVSLPATLRERGYYLTGPLPMYYALQNIPCIEFYNYANFLDMTFPYTARWSHFFWNKITIKYRNWSSCQHMPIFHYYHLLTSHYPYVFDTNGGYLRSAKDSFITLRASFSYTEKLLLQLIREIQDSRRSNPRPYAILIFSDHGPYELGKSPYSLAPDTARVIAHSAWAALYTSWALPDSTRQAFLHSTHHQHLGQVLLKIANPI